MRSQAASLAVQPPDVVLLISAALTSVFFPHHLAALVATCGTMRRMLAQTLHALAEYQRASSADRFLSWTTTSTQLGSGTYGMVTMATHNATGEVVALKSLTLDEDDEGIPVTALREAALLKTLRHENVVRFARPDSNRPTPVRLRERDNCLPLLTRQAARNLLPATTWYTLALP